MKQIYLVHGFCGEYSDRAEWTVCAYTDKDEAQAHAERATKACKGSKNWGWERRSKFKNPYDANFRTDYTGTSYHIEAITLWEPDDSIPGLNTNAE